MATVFYSNGHTYQIVLLAGTWTAASQYAQGMGAHLATISSVDEQTAVQTNVAQSVSLTSPYAPDGGNAVYVWLGASDSATEGSWKWVDGTPVSSYTNWGSGVLGAEPDDYLGKQDALAMGVEAWPYPNGGIGVAGQWNDLDAANPLYFVIEWDTSIDKTTDTVAPTLTSASPVDDGADVGIASNIVFTFSEPIQRGSGNIVLKDSSGTVIETFNAPTSSKLQVVATKLTVNPSADLDYGKGYTLEIAAGSILDIAGNGYAGTTAYNFTTVSDTTAPVAPVPVGNSALNFLTEPQVTLQTSQGTIVVELDPERAPVTVANMLAYVNEGYYDGTLFHRVIPGFMIQGGGFTAGLAVKSPTYGAIPLESNNGLANLRGTIAMARTSAPDSATSQFFINQVDNAFLNYSSVSSPGYAVFGKVVSGLPVIDAITAVATATVGQYQNVPVADVSITSVRQTIAGSAVTNAASLTLSGLENGAAWTYTLDGGATWKGGNGNALVVPVGEYAADAIQVRQTDAAGNQSIASGKFGSALIVETSPPAIVSFSPADEATGIAVGSNIVFTFSENIARGSGVIVLKNAAGTTIESYDAADSARLNVAGNTLTIDPTADLAAYTAYRLELAAGNVNDLAGNSHAGSSNYNFKTAPPPNTSPSGTVSITGQASQGQTLTVDTLALTDADGLGAFAYEWMADSVPIAGAKLSTLILSEAQVGKAVSVTLSYVDGYGTAEAIVSAATAAVANVNDLPQGRLKVTGLPTPEQTLSAIFHVTDADGLGSFAYQWQSSGDGVAWTDVAGATSLGFAVAADYVGQQLRVVGSYLDAHGTAETLTSQAIAIAETYSGKTANVLVYAWKSHVVLDAVTVATANASQITDANGTASFANITDSSLGLAASRGISVTEASATDQAVNLQDAIGILKMIVGLDVNGVGKALSPYQAFAADYDGNGQVQLTDAIGVLKHVVGLAAPAPAWHFASETDAAIPKVAALSPGAPPAISVDLSEVAPSLHVGLAAYLSGDVDGSYAGMAGSPDLDETQPGYFVSLIQDQGLDPAQFGVYS